MGRRLAGQITIHTEAEELGFLLMQSYTTYQISKEGRKVLPGTWRPTS